MKDFRDASPGNSANSGGESTRGVKAIKEVFIQYSDGSLDSSASHEHSAQQHPPVGNQCDPGGAASGASASLFGSKPAH